MEELMAQEAQGQDSQGSGVGQEEPMTDAEIASMVIEEHKVRACMRGIFYCSVYCVHSTYLAHSIYKLCFTGYADAGNPREDTPNHAKDPGHVQHP